MSHPFDLDPSDLEALDLDFEEQLMEEESAQVGGGLTIYTTDEVGEEGGFKPYPLPLPKPIPFPKPIHPIKPPEATTLAIGEEGGGPIYTKALWENG